MLDTEKIFGYIMFAVGLCCILFALSSMRSVFTGATLPPEIFQMQTLNFTVNLGPNNPPAAMSMALDPEIRKLANMFLYYLFMFFVVLVGGKIGSLGIQLTKEVKWDKKNLG